MKDSCKLSNTKSVNKTHTELKSSTNNKAVVLEPVYKLQRGIPVSYYYKKWYYNSFIYLKCSKRCYFRHKNDK